MTTVSLVQRPAWKALEAHYQKVRDVHLRTLFAEDPRRGERLAVEAVGLYFDYSKHRITDETMRLLIALAEECGLRQHDREPAGPSRGSPRSPWRVDRGRR